jgi:hypothetical protein
MLILTSFGEGHTKKVLAAEPEAMLQREAKYGREG